MRLFYPFLPFFTSLFKSATLSWVGLGLVGLGSILVGKGERKGKGWGTKITFAVATCDNLFRRAGGYIFFPSMHVLPFLVIFIFNIFCFAFQVL